MEPMDLAIEIERFMVAEHVNKDDAIGYLLDALYAADMEANDETA
jgi:hypothetical protein